MKKSTRLSLFGVAVALNVFAFNNCSNVTFTEVPNEESSSILSHINPPPVTVNEAITNCTTASQNGTLIPYDQVIRFENTKVETGRNNVCIYNADNNLSMLNNYLRARYEQRQVIQLPANAVICSAELNSTSDTFEYDDMFYLNYNGYVIASSLMRSLTGLQATQITLPDGKTESLYRYDWLGVRDANFNGVNENSDNYCLGSANGFGQCQWPNSQRNGRLSMTFNPNLTIALGLKAQPTEQSFSFIVTGDDDPGSDCTHERLDLNLRMTYYLRN